MITLKTKIWGEEYSISGDFTQAASPVFFDGKPSQYQVADFKHNDNEALRVYLTDVAKMSGDFDEKEKARIERAIANAEYEDKENEENEESED